MDSDKLIDTIMASQLKEDLVNTDVLTMVNKAFGGLKRKQRHVLRRRYGLNGDKKTLQEIGDSYGVTRERIRQIEKAAIKKLRKEVNIKYFLPVTSLVLFELEQSGGIIAEKTLARRIFGENASDINLNGMRLILEVYPDVTGIKECDHKYESWCLGSCDIDRVVGIILDLVGYLDSRGDIVSLDELHTEIGTRHGVELKHTEAISDLSKLILSTADGRYGLKKWSFINPKNIRDKIFFVLNKVNKPLHFMEITDLIRKEDFIHSKNITHQAVHNELISDDRYVLIGKGIYALTDWGYRPGTVSDVIVNLMSEKGVPMSKEDIVREVLKNRIVKKNTIVINLHNKEKFVRTKEGLYFLKLEKN